MWIAGAILVAAVLVCMTIQGGLNLLRRDLLDRTKKLDEINSSLRTIVKGLDQFFQQEFEANQKQRKKEIDAILKRSAADGTLRIFDQ